MAHCRVNNIGVDVTVNQLGSLASMYFLEEADLIIGRHHLLKRSILLIKSWCQHDSVAHCGRPIIGAKDGMLSSYAISVLVLYLFNKYPKGSFVHPLVVLRAFLLTYSNPEVWDSDCIITVGGAVPYHSGSHGVYKWQSLLPSVQNQFQTQQMKVKSMINTIGREDGFPVRAFNIEDPIDPGNNLGMSIQKRNISTIQVCTNISASAVDQLSG